MQPIRPAERVERPPPAASPQFNVDSPEDDSETTTESSYILSQQFQMLPWPSLGISRSGCESPIPLPRGVSPASSMPPTHTPESSLTAWSGAFVVHNYGHTNSGGSVPNTSLTSNAATGGVVVGASWASTQRDVATFDLLRANSGRAASRETGANGGSSGRNRTGAGNNSNNNNDKPANAALTEANVDFLRRISSAAAGGAGGVLGRKGARATPQNGGRPPKAQPYTSNTPPQAAGAAAAAAATASAANDRGGAHANGSTPAGHAGPAVTILNRKGPAEPAATAAEDSIDNLRQKRASAAPAMAAATLRRQFSPSSGDGEHETVTHADDGKHAATAVVADTNTAKSPKAPEPRRCPRASSGAATTTSTDATSLTAPSREERAANADTVYSTDSRPRRTSSRHQAEMPRVNTPSLKPGVQPTLSSPMPSPSAAASRGGTRRQATTLGRRPTTDMSATGESSPAGATPSTAAAGFQAGPAATPAKPAGTAAAAKTVPSAPCQYMSGGRLVHAARRLAVALPVAAPTVAAAAPKVSKRKSPRTRDVPNRNRSKTCSPPPSPPFRLATEMPVDHDANRDSNSIEQHNSSGVPAVTAAATPAETEELGSLVSCSMRTIPPAKARELRVTQPPAASSTTDTPPVDQTAATAVTASNQTTTIGAALAPKATASQLSAAPANDAGSSSDAGVVEGRRKGADAQKDDSVKLLHTVEVTRLVTQPPSPGRALKSATRTETSPTAAASKSTPPPPPPLFGTSSAAGPLAFNQQPSSLLAQATFTAAPNVSETPKRAPPKSQSESSQNSEDSLTGPPTSTRSRRSTGGSSNNPQRRSATGSRSSNNTSHEWNVNASSEYLLSAGSTQAPLSVRLPAPSLQSATAPINGCSSSCDTSDHCEREADSFISALGASANNTTTENLSNRTDSTAMSLAARHRARLPQPPFSLDGVGTTPQKGEVATGKEETSPLVHELRGHGGDAVMAADTPAPPPPLLTSQPSSIPPNAALRARRSSYAVTGSAERLQLTKRRGSAPAQAEQRSSITGSAGCPSPPGAATITTGATTDGFIAAGRRSRPRSVVVSCLNSNGDKSAKAGTRAPNSGGYAAAATTTMMVVGGRQLPHMFPSSDEDLAGAANRSVTSGRSATTAPATAALMKEPNTAVMDAEKTTASLANRRYARSVPPRSSSHGDGKNAEAAGFDTQKPSPAAGREFNVTRGTRTDRGSPCEHPPLSESHLQGGESAVDDATSRRTRNVSDDRNDKEREGDTAVDGVMLPPALESGGRTEGRDTAFQSSSRRLPALTRFPRTPISAGAGDVSCSAPQPNAHFTTNNNNHNSSSADDARQESSGSRHANSRDSNAPLPSRRRRPSGHLPGGATSIACDSNASSFNNRADAAHSEGSTAGERPDLAPHTKSLRKKTPQPRQRAPSVFFDAL